MEGTLAIFAIIGLAFIIFNIYFIFKILQFIIMAINLYKKMVNRHDAMLKLLLDIRDNTKKYESIISSSSEVIDNMSSNADDDGFICEECKSAVPANAKSCPKCGVEFE